MAETVNVVCGKCSGAGRILAFSHRDDGICYDCRGVGTASVDLVGYLVNRGCRVAILFEVGDLDGADSLARETAKEMHEAGTQTAKEALNTIARGGNPPGYAPDVDPYWCKIAADLIIRRGREQKAA